MPFGCDLRPLAAHSDLRHDAGMDDDHELILIAAYRNLDSAKTDSANSRSGSARTRGEGGGPRHRDADGQPHVVEAHNKHGRVAAGMGAGLGLMFGLFVPPFGLAVLVGGRPGRWSHRSPTTRCAPASA